MRIKEHLQSLKSSLTSMWEKGERRIEVFVRHCHLSTISQHKVRFADFSKQRCYENLLSSIDRNRVNVTFLLDTFHPVAEDHFLNQQKDYPVISIKEGTEAGSFLRLLDHVEKLKLHPETIVYFLEDDYLHREGWTDIMLEGFALTEADYVTLYDHRDKYFLPEYQNLQSKIFHTHSCHWRTTPSTTNTYAMKFKTLKKHLPIHREFSQDRKISSDHDKFCKLSEMGSFLISSIPGWATHAEPEYASPCIPWENNFKP